MVLYLGGWREVCCDIVRGGGWRSVVVLYVGGWRSVVVLCVERWREVCCGVERRGMEGGLLWCCT